jgi:DNA-binding MarR family transcriptional regulator
MAIAERECPKAPDGLTDAALDALWEFVGIADASLVAAGVQVTLTQFRALTMIVRHGPLPATTLARLVGVAPSSATRMCDRLVRDGLLDRRPSLEDRRVVTLSLTRQGGAVVRNVTKWRRRALAERFADLGSERRVELASALEECAFVLGSREVTV